MSQAEYHFAERPHDVPSWDVDPYDTGVLLNPEPYYDALIEQAPFVYLEKYGILATGRHEIVKQILTDHETFVSGRGVGLRDVSVVGNWRKPSPLLETDPPEHSRVRQVVMAILNPKALKDLQEGIERKAQDLVAGALDRGRIEGVEDVGAQLALSIFPDAFGLTSEDRRPLLEYAGILLNSFGPDNALRRAAMARSEEITPIINEQLRRENLRPDGWGQRIYAEVDAGRLTEEEAFLLCRSFLTAGVHTTSTAMGDALYSLATNPEEFAKLKADPRLAKPAFEEAQRRHTQAHSFCRTVNADTEVAGVRIKKGTKVLVVTAAANLDPGKWDAPKAYRVDRRPVGHFAFSGGIHSCAGQNLARNEGGALLKALAEQVCKIELAGDIVRVPNNGSRSYTTLPLQLTA